MGFGLRAQHLAHRLEDGDLGVAGQDEEGIHQRCASGERPTVYAGSAAVQRRAVEGSGVESSARAVNSCRGIEGSCLGGR